MVFTAVFSPEWVFRSRVLEQYLHCKLQGWRKVFFTTNLMSVDLLQNTPKTRKPIAERTSHKWHGYTHQGVQQSLLHQTTATPLTECTERTEPSCRERTPTDGTDLHRCLECAVLPQNSRNSQNLAAWVWQECHTLLICEHPCSSVGSSSLSEGSVCSVRSVGISFLPRMAQIDTDGWGALFSHGIHGIHRIWQRGYGRNAIPS